MKCAAWICDKYIAAFLESFHWWVLTSSSAEESDIQYRVHLPQVHLPPIGVVADAGADAVVVGSGAIRVVVDSVARSAHVEGGEGTLEACLAERHIFWHKMNMWITSSSS